MGHNKIMQPEINQPRVSDEHGQSGLKKAGILNLVADDLPHDMSLGLRQNIIKHANEVYHMGTQNNSEYATVLDSTTGELLDGNKTYHLITNNSFGNVSIPDDVLSKRQKDEVIIIHNHTNGTLPSNDDVKLLTANLAVLSVLTVSGGRLLRLAKSPKLSYNIKGNNIDKDIELLVRTNFNIGHYLADGSVEDFEKSVKIFNGYGLLLERW